VELYFGPVGHTHNGNDSVHHGHNNIAGDFSMVTLPEFLSKFSLAWTNNDARPWPVYVEDVYDWQTYYTPHMSRVKGLMASGSSELYVRAIKLQMGPSQKVEMMYKGSPSNTKWLGLTEPDPRYPRAEGFVILNDIPEGSPDILESSVPQEVIRQVKRSLQHPNLIDFVQANELAGGLAWLAQTIEGKLPTRGLSENPPMSKSVNFGKIEVVGVGNRTIDLPIIRPERITQEKMFVLPLALLQTINDRNELLTHVRVTDRDARVEYAKKNRTQNSSVRGVVRQLFSNPPELDEKHNTVELSSEESQQSDDELTEYDPWRPDVKECQVGGFAAVNANYAGQYDLALVKVPTFRDCQPNMGK